MTLKQLAPRLVALALVANAAAAAEKRDLDVFLERQDLRELTPAATAARVEHTDRLLGVPTFVRGDRQAPPGLTRAASPSQAARAHLNRHADMFRLSGHDVAAARIS